MDEIWNLGHLYKPDVYTSKYDVLASERSNYRVLYINDIVKHKEIDIPSYLLKFVAREGAVLMIANIVLSKVISILFRSLKRKLFLDMGTTKGVFYGLGEFSEFKYGDPIIVVEGVADRDILSKIYPYVLATKSSSLSIIQIEILSCLTNKVILALDQDVPGRSGCILALKRLKKKNVRCFIFDHPDVKDPGSIYDYAVAKNYSRAKELIKDYSLRIEAGIQWLS